MNNISLRPISSCLAALYVLTLIVLVAGKSGSDGLITVRSMSWLLREIGCSAPRARSSWFVLHHVCSFRGPSLS